MTILNPFPELLVYSFFAPTLLRLAAACIFAYLAYQHFQHRHKIAQIHFPLMRGAWVVNMAFVVEGLLALALILGYYTQVAAIAGTLVALKEFVWRNRYPAFFILPRTASFLLFVILFSLLMTGAGALALDLPL